MSLPTSFTQSLRRTAADQKALQEVRRQRDQEDLFRKTKGLLISLPHDLLLTLLAARLSFERARMLSSAVARIKQESFRMNALRRFEPYAYALLRIVAGLLFLFHGLQKFGLLGGEMVPPASMRGRGGGDRDRRRTADHDRMAGGAGGVHLQRRDGLRLFHDAPAARNLADSERRRARRRCSRSSFSTSRRAARDAERRAAASEVRLSRRSFVRAAAGSLLVPQAGFAQSTARSITAAQLVERIRATSAWPWREKTIDGFKAGSPATA